MLVPLIQCSCWLISSLSPPSQDRPPEPAAILEAPDGAREVLRWSELDLAAIAPRAAALLRLEGLEAPAALDPSSAARVVLAGGDRAEAEVRGGSGDWLELGLRGGARLEAQVDRVIEIVFSGRMAPEVLAGLGPAERGDLLFWLRPGGELDRVPGTLLEFAPEGPRWEGSFGERTFAWSEIGALYIEPLGAPEVAEPTAGQPGLRPGVRAVVDLWDGGRLSGKLLSLGAGGLRLEHSPGRVVDLGLGAVAEVLADDGRVRYLSDLAPTSADEPGPFGDGLGLSWPHRRDRSVTGSALQAGGRTWLRGLGVHAPSRLTYALDGGWEGLRGSVAVDDQVLLLSARGAVEFHVLVDGELRWSSGVVRGGDTPLDMGTIDLAGARELALVVEMSDDHFVADRADWLRPLLVRALP